MLNLLTHLECRYEPRNSILMDGMTEAQEVIFVTKGSVDLGYRYGDKIDYILRYTDSVIIGAYSCTFNACHPMFFKSQTVCQGYSIRKREWKSLLVEFSDLQAQLSQNIKHDFEGMRVKMMKASTKARRVIGQESNDNKGQEN